MDRYKVTITYSEPTYAQARGIAELSYRGCFVVTAFDPETAIVLATELFEAAQRGSGVSWVRVIKATRWERLERSKAAAQ